MLQMPRKAEENVERIRSKKSFWDYRPRPLRWLRQHCGSTRIVFSTLAGILSLIAGMISAVLLASLGRPFLLVPAVFCFLLGTYFYVWFMNYGFQEDW